MQPKSDSSDSRSETGSEKKKKPKIKKVVAVKKILRKKLTRGKNKKSAGSDSEEEFHGFTDSEIETASLKSDRSLLTKSLSEEPTKSKQKKIKSVPRKSKKSLDRSDENSVVSVDSDGKEEDLIVSGKRKWKPSLKVQENNKKKEKKTKIGEKTSVPDENKPVKPDSDNLQTSVKVSKLNSSLQL